MKAFEVPQQRRVKTKLTFSFYPSSGIKTSKVKAKNKYHKYDTKIQSQNLKQLETNLHLSRNLVQICNFCPITGNGATKTKCAFQKVNIFLLQV